MSQHHNPFKPGDYAVDRYKRYWEVIAVFGPWCWLKPGDDDAGWPGPWNELARNLRRSDGTTQADVDDFIERQFEQERSS